MSNNHEDLIWFSIKITGLAVLNFIAQNINEILHIATGALSLVYLVWRFRRDWKREQERKNKIEDWFDKHH